MLPTEAIENICLLVDEPDDLKSLTCVSRLFASIACHIYAVQLGIHVKDTSRFVQIRGKSFQALATWQRSRLFSCLHDKYLLCDINEQELQTANMQIRALRHFLSMTFVTRPFAAVYINSADALSPSEILQFIQLIDGAGCQTVSISTGLSNPQWFRPLASPCAPRLTTMSLAHLRSLDIDNQYFSAQHWSSLLCRLMGPNLETLSIRGQPTIRAISQFLSRHSHINTFHFQPRWGTHDQCIKSGAFPQRIKMAQLSEINGPPRHLMALLQCLSPASPALTLKMGCDRTMTYPQYVHTVLRSVGLCGPYVHLEIRLPPCYDLVLDWKEMESLHTITLPEVVSLEISFPPLSERDLLVCFHTFNAANLIHQLLDQACCTQWFSLVPMLDCITVYVSSRIGRRRSTSATDADIVVGPRNGSVTHTSGGTQVMWDTELE